VLSQGADICTGLQGVLSNWLQQLQVATWQHALLLLLRRQRRRLLLWLPLIPATPFLSYTNAAGLLTSYISVFIKGATLGNLLFPSCF
jgi:hypothetical protein